MAKIKIKDLPRDMKISEGEMRKARGGALPDPIPYQRSLRKVGVLPSLYAFGSHTTGSVAAPFIPSGSSVLAATIGRRSSRGGNK